MYIEYLGNIHGAGPKTNMPSEKRRIPAKIILMKFFLESGTKLRANDTAINVIVSIE